MPTLAFFADVSVVAEDAKIGDTHVRVGMVAGDGGAAIWPLLIGPNRVFSIAALWYMLIAAEGIAAMGLYLRVAWREERSDFWPMLLILAGISA